MLDRRELNCTVTSLLLDTQLIICFSSSGFVSWLCPLFVILSVCQINELNHWLFALQYMKMLIKMYIMTVISVEESAFNWLHCWCRACVWVLHSVLCASVAGSNGWHYLNRWTRPHENVMSVSSYRHNIHRTAMTVTNNDRWKGVLEEFRVDGDNLQTLLMT